MKANKVLINALSKAVGRKIRLNKPEGETARGGSKQAKESRDPYDGTGE